MGTWRRQSAGPSLLAVALCLPLAAPVQAPLVSAAPVAVAPPKSPSRQNFDASTPIKTTETTSTTTQTTQRITPESAPASAQAASQNPIPAFAEDIESVDVEFNVQHIRDLLATGTVDVEVPGYQATLTLANYSQWHGTTHIKAMHAGLPTTITERNGTFFATLATPERVWRIQGRADRAYATLHRTIASQRSLGHKDFVHAPH